MLFGNKSITIRQQPTILFLQTKNHFSQVKQLKRTNDIIIQTHHFFKDVHEVAKLIPVGKVTSYGAIAKYLGTGRSARMVGWAMNQAHFDSEIPAHRVVNRNGLLTGKVHFHPPSVMQKKLEAEGVKVKNDQILNFKDHFWDPMKELD